MLKLFFEILLFLCKYKVYVLLEYCNYVFREMYLHFYICTNYITYNIICFSKRKHKVLLLFLTKNEQKNICLRKIEYKLVIKKINHLFPFSKKSAFAWLVVYVHKFFFPLSTFTHNKKKVKPIKNKINRNINCTPYLY